MKVTFPIIKSTKEEKAIDFPDFVPYLFVLKFEEQIKSNHRQTMDRLKERGGLGIKELAWAINGGKFRDFFENTNLEEAAEIIKSALDKFFNDAWLDAHK